MKISKRSMISMLRMMRVKLECKSLKRIRIDSRTKSENFKIKLQQTMAIRLTTSARLTNLNKNKRSWEKKLQLSKLKTRISNLPTKNSKPIKQSFKNSFLKARFKNNNMKMTSKSSKKSSLKLKLRSKIFEKVLKRMKRNTRSLRHRIKKRSRTSSRWSRRI